MAGPSQKPSYAFDVSTAGILNMVLIFLLESDELYLFQASNEITLYSFGSEMHEDHNLVYTIILLYVGSCRKTNGEPFEHLYIELDNVSHNKAKALPRYF